MGEEGLFRTHQKFPRGTISGGGIQGGGEYSGRGGEVGLFFGLRKLPDKIICNEAADKPEICGPKLYNLDEGWAACTKMDATVQKGKPMSKRMEPK